MLRFAVLVLWIAGGCATRRAAPAPKVACDTNPCVQAPAAATPDTRIACESPPCVAPVAKPDVTPATKLACDNPPCVDDITVPKDRPTFPAQTASPARSTLPIQ